MTEARDHFLPIPQRVQGGMRNIRGFPNIKADVTLRFSASLLEGRREYSLIVRDSKRGIVRLLGQPFAWKIGRIDRGD